MILLIIVVLLGMMAIIVMMEIGDGGKVEMTIIILPESFYAFLYKLSNRLSCSQEHLRRISLSFELAIGKTEVG